jgi:membrane protein YdbS with pleckstrin-like domain
MMPLSDYERRVLAQIESEFASVKVRRRRRNLFVVRMAVVLFAVAAIVVLAVLAAGDQLPAAVVAPVCAALGVVVGLMVIPRFRAAPQVPSTVIDRRSDEKQV